MVRGITSDADGRTGGPPPTLLFWINKADFKINLYFFVCRVSAPLNEYGGTVKCTLEIMCEGYSPGLRAEAIPSQLEDLEAKAEQDCVLIPYRTHQDPQHHRLQKHNAWQKALSPVADRCNNSNIPKIRLWQSWNN